MCVILARVAHSEDPLFPPLQLKRGRGGLFHLRELLERTRDQVSFVDDWSRELDDFRELETWRRRVRISPRDSDTADMDGRPYRNARGDHYHRRRDGETTSCSLVANDRSVSGEGSAQVDRGEELEEDHLCLKMKGYDVRVARESR